MGFDKALAAAELWSCNSCQQGPHDLSVHIRQPEVTSLKTDSQPFVIHTEQMQDGGMQVGYVVALAECMVAEFIGGSVNVALF